jgi:phosphodiesterase/alkaline phosphatase D-like protein
MLTTPKLRAWLQEMGVRAIYDDHEFRNDWDAMFVAAEQSRYAAAMQVWDEFFPVRGAAGEVRYRAFRWGAHVECFLLDCRRFRSANAAPDDANKTMLGTEQRAWLVDAVQRSPATFKLVFTSVPLDFGDGIDHWAAYTVERQAIFDALVGVPGVLFVSADQHWFAAHRHARGIREFQVGPLCRGILTPQRDAPGVLFRSMQYNFGLIDVDGDTLTFSGVGPDGTVFYKETLTAADLTPAP